MNASKPTTADEHYRDELHRMANDALRAFWDREDIGTPQWWEAKRIADVVCRAQKRAFEAVADARREPLPYWWVRSGTYAGDPDPLPSGILTT